MILYADTITPSMKAAIDETERRRKLQNDYNAAHGIVPKTKICARSKFFKLFEIF